MLPRRFALVRHVDYTGVSGVGVVAHGVAFADGHIALRWCSEHPATSIWGSIDDLLAVHGHGQATSVEWIDAPHGKLEDLPAQGAGRRARNAAKTEQEQARATAPDGADNPPAPDEGDARPAPHEGDAQPAPGDTDAPPGPDREPEPPPAARPWESNGHPGADTAPLLVGERSSATGTDRQQDAGPRSSRPGRHRRPVASDELPERDH
ncbi:MAG: hypothetical protein ACODAF_01915 [Actinomycetota bacterium]